MPLIKEYEIYMTLNIKQPANVHRIQVPTEKFSVHVFCYCWSFSLLKRSSLQLDYSQALLQIWPEAPGML